MLRRACVVAALLATLAAPAPAHAYEFWLRAKTIGQAYQLREYRLVGPDIFLGRHRVTQWVALRLFDIGDLAAKRRMSRLPGRGPRITWQSYLRIDHDFGDFTSGRIALSGPIRRDAIDVIPDLADSVAGLDLMYGFLEIDGMFDDRLRFQVGRILIEDGWTTGAYDGAGVRFELPVPITIGASAGVRVRQSSYLGVSQYELNGTAGANCQEYVEGPTPGTGAWQLVDRNRAIHNSKLSSDYEFCPQRLAYQPTVGASLTTARTHGVAAELGYRRTWSRTVGLIGPVDRLDYPDRGLYPNDYGQAPATGVDEERLFARVDADFRSGSVRLSPYAAARFSLLNGVFDRGDAGVRIKHGDHVLEPSVEYYFPTFDGDSIFNAFSIDPTTDARFAYQYAPPGPWRGRASAWLRKYESEPELWPVAGGFDASIEHAFGGGWRGRADALWDDGWGGRRIGGAVDGAYRGIAPVWWRARMIVLGVDEDDTTQFRKFVTTSGVASATIRIAENVGVHVMAEVDYDRIHELQTRVIGVIDLAFAPEP